MLENYDDGRSRSYFCRAANTLDMTFLENALKKAENIVKAEHVEQGDKKRKANILRTFLEETA